MLTYLLLSIGASTWPLSDNIFLGLVVGRESKSDTREGSTLMVVC